jgi:peptide/nickel transport system substrate-binding protein
MNMKKILSIALTFLMMLSLITGCTNNNAETPEPEATPAEESTETPAETASAPKVGGSLVVGLTGDPYSLATWNSNDLNSSLLMNLILPPLMVTDEDGKKVPYVVKDYEISEDALTYTVTINEGITWHDGTPFTVEDLKFTANYMVENALGYGADMYGGVKDMEIVDDYTIKYFLESPQVNFLSQVGFWIDIMPKHIFESVEDPANFEYDGLGYGPYKLKDYVKGQYYTLERVPEWPLANDGMGAYLEEITFRIFPDANALVLAIMNGEVNVSGSAIPIAAQKQLQSKPDEFGIMDVNSLGFGYFSFNYKNEFLKDFEVRKAIAMTLDRDAFVNIAMQGGAIKMESPISPVFTDLVKSGIKFPEFNIEEAKSVLETAGYKDSDGDGIRENPAGKKMEIELVYRTTTSNVDAIANVFKANVEQVGIAVNLKPVDPATYTDMVTKGRTFDMNVIDWGVIDDADSSLATIYRSDASLNFMGYSNPKIDELLDQSAAEPDYQKRIEIMNEFQEEFIKEIPAIGTWVRINAYGYSKDYEGWDLTPGLYGLVDVKDLVKVYEK